MRVAFDAKRIFKNSTGLGNYSRMVAQGLSGFCDDVEMLLCSPSTDGPYKHLFDNDPKVQIIEPQGFAKKIKGLWRSFSSGIKSGSEIDIFHGLSQELPHFLPKNVKKIVTVHDLIAWRYPQYFSVFDRNIYKTKIKHACKTADIVIAVSRQTADDLVRFIDVPEDKIHVAYQTCHDNFRKMISAGQLSEIRSKYSLPDNYIVCVGTVEKRKNQVAIVEALMFLPEDLSVVFVGKKTKYAEKVLKTAKNNGLENRVVILDNAKFEDLPELYRNSILSVYMSHFEGFGIPVLESLTCGTPVVTSGISSMPEAGGGAALYADPDNPRDIADKCIFAMNNDTFSKEFRQKAEEHCRKFEPEHIISELHSIYTELLKK